LFIVGGTTIPTSCADTCDQTNVYTYFQPVYTSLDEIRKGISQTEPHTIKQVGKIYYKDGFLFVNQPGEGIHIINNLNPASPEIKSFVKIPGNYELAIKGNTLYADSYIDLVALDIENLESVKEVGRINGLFSGYNSLGFYVDPLLGVVTDWSEQKEVTVSESDCDQIVQQWGGVYYERGVAFEDASAFNVEASVTPGNGSSGVGGSMARFTIANDYLYALDEGNVCPIDISDVTNPLSKSKLFIGWDIETIFPSQQNLFIGSSSGMHIMDISNPSSPSIISTYQHITSCDPVVVSGNFAYVTLRSGTECQGFTNQLEVIDIQNLSTPNLLATHEMQNPHGLGIDNTTLFICDGSAGLKVFDASNPSTISSNLLAHYNSINAYDVIPFGNTLMMIGEDGIFQYDYSNPKEIKLLSSLLIDHHVE